MSKLRLFQCTRPGVSGARCVMDLDLAMQELRESLEADELGEVTSFRLVEMTQAERDRLPEFEGW